MAKRVIATIHLPMEVSRFSELMIAIDKVFPGATSRPGKAKNKMEVLAEVE